MDFKYEPFGSFGDIMGMPPPENKPAVEVWHKTQAGFGVRIMKARADGKVRRAYISRIPVLQPNGKYKEEKPVLGLVAEIGTGDAMLTYREAEATAMRLFRDAKIRKAGGTVRMTVGQAYEKLQASLTSGFSTDSPDYGEKMTKVYERFLRHLEERNLDELKAGFWIDFLTALRNGTLEVPGRGKRRAPSANYAMSVLNTAGRLYRIAHEYQGIEGEQPGWDPTRVAFSKIEAPNKRETFVKLEDLSKAWHATDQLMSPWWRDLWRIYLLTGLRDRLVMDMKWSQIDFDRNVYLIDPLQQGTKRRRKKMSQVERAKPIEMPLSSYVMNILRRRKAHAPKGADNVWYSIETVRRKEGEKPLLSDPRSAWKRLTPIIGYWVYKHDLRRTFASIGATVAPSAVISLSLLLLHSNKSAATALGVPQITVDYVKGQQRGMRALTEQITQAVLEVVGEAPRTALTAHLDDYAELPESVSSLLSIEDRAPERGQDYEVLEEEEA